LLEYWFMWERSIIFIDCYVTGTRYHFGHFELVLRDFHSAASCWNLLQPERAREPKCSFCSSKPIALLGFESMS